MARSMNKEHEKEDELVSRGVGSRPIYYVVIRYDTFFMAARARRG